MKLMINELASINLFVIWIIIIGGYAFLRYVKRKLAE